jgi:membrane dipeptidase
MQNTAAASVLALLALGCATSAPHDASTDARARRLAREVVIVDGHIDVPYRLHAQKEAGRGVDDVTRRTEGGDFDVPRAVEGGLDAPFFSIFTPAECEARGTSKALADELIDLVEGIVRRAPERLVLARTAAEVRAAKASGRIAILLGMENGSPIEGSLANLDHFFERGVRYVTLCHSEDNHVCDSSYDTRHTHRGLTPFGRDVVARMNELGMLVDVSHVSDDAFWQVIELSRAPVIASHSSLRHFVPGFERNMSDEMLIALARNGGVVQINFGSTFLEAGANSIGGARWQAARDFARANGVSIDDPRVEAHMREWATEHPFPYADVTDVADHIEHAAQVAGVDHVGLGSDFDGVGDSLPTGLKDVSQYPNLIAELLRRGWSERDVAKVCGENVLRVMERAEAVARASLP